MSISQSDVNAMQSKVNQLRYENSQLRNEINAMVSSVNSAGGSVIATRDAALGTLTGGENTIKKDDNVLHNVSKKQDEIRRMMELYKNMENAYKTIRGLNNELRYHQNGEKNVRKMVVAMIDNELKSLASEETIAEQAEKQYLQTQYFFLSHVMMDLQLRKRGEPEAADRAREEALKLDERRSVWVYFLIALRRDDEKEKDYWIDKLVKSPLVGSEEKFLKVLAVIALCDKGKCAEKVRAYIGIDNISGEDKAPFVSKISAEYAGVMKTRPPKFKYIENHVEEKAALDGALFGAMNNESVAAYIRKLAGGSSSDSRAQFYSDMLDECVEYCRSPKSDEIRDKIAYQEKIIEAKGVIEDAMALKAKEDVRLVSDLNVEDCLFRWLTDNERFAGKKEITEFSYEKFKSSYKRAYRDYVKSYRDKYTDRLTVHVGDYSAKTSLRNAEEDEKNIEKFLTDRCNRTKAAIKDTKFYLMVVFGAILVVAGIVCNFLQSVIPFPWNVVLLVACVAAGLLLVGFGIRAKYLNYKARIRADEQLAQDRIKYFEMLRCLYSDVEAYREMYAQYDAKALDEREF